MNVFNTSTLLNSKEFLSTVSLTGRKISQLVILWGWSGSWATRGTWCCRGTSRGWSPPPGSPSAWSSSPWLVQSRSPACSSLKMRTNQNHLLAVYVVCRTNRALLPAASVKIRINQNLLLSGQGSSGLYPYLNCCRPKNGPMKISHFLFKAI